MIGNNDGCTKYFYPVFLLMFYRLFLTVLYNHIYIQSITLAFVITKAKINMFYS